MLTLASQAQALIYYTSVITTQVSAKLEGSLSNMEL